MRDVAKEGRLSDLATPESVRKLQTALHAKAKAEPEFRFYLLYDKVYRGDVLSHAYDRCKANGGAGGVDGQSFADIEASGVAAWLGELAKELRSRTYRAEAVRRVFIPKPNSKKKRPLGIATIRDRVAQTAAMMVLEPIFEADLQPEQHAYRAGISALDAVGAVHRLLNTGHTAVVDADLRGYFDEIPHEPLMKSVARRVSDRHMLHLIKMWIEAPVEETDERGTSEGRRAIGMSTAAYRRARRYPRCCRTCTCGGWSCGGRHRARSGGFAQSSSTMLTTW